MTDTTIITTLRTDQCQSLSGRSTLTYELGTDPEDRLHLRVTHNTGKGHFNPSWVAWEAIKPLLIKAPTLAASALVPLFAGTSVNNAGFVLAMLKHLGVVQAALDQRHAYQYVQTTDWKAILQTPMVASGPAKEDAKGRSKRAAA